MIEKLKIPGVDTRALVDSRRKDIEALISANERAFAAFEALSRKQSDLLAELVREWQAGAKEVIGEGGAADKLNQAAAHAQKAFVDALAAMKDMAEIAATSSRDVVQILDKRFNDGIVELRKAFGFGMKH
jgi:phasin family protein